MSVTRTAAHVARGALIGLVEIVPGVSGGTVALVVGVYESLIESAGALVSGLVALVVDPLRGRGTARARAELAAVQWGLVVPILVGMAVAVLAAAALLAPVIEEHPVGTRAFFCGLIVVSIAIPARMVGGRWRAREVGSALAAAVVAFVLTGLPPANVDEPALWIVALAAAVAICALVMPGLSGSFVLLAIGLYEPTLAAVNERNLTYVAAFGLGAVIGLGLFVEVLRWLLRHHHRITLAVMTGVMAGSLRALWPWQDADGGLSSPSGDLAVPIMLFVLGAAVVTAFLVSAGGLTRRSLPDEAAAR